MCGDLIARLCMPSLRPSIYCVQVTARLGKEALSRHSVHQQERRFHRSLHVSQNTPPRLHELARPSAASDSKHSSCCYHRVVHYLGKGSSRRVVGLRWCVPPNMCITQSRRPSLGKVFFCCRDDFARSGKSRLSNGKNRCLLFEPCLNI